MYVTFKTHTQKIRDSTFYRIMSCYTWFRDQLMNLKAGEEKKKKHYLALCICSDAIEPGSLEQLGNIKDLTLSQKTPVRVLHRRPLATRSRTVHSMKAWLLENPTKLCKNGKDITDFILFCNIVWTCSTAHFEHTVIFLKQLSCKVYHYHWLATMLFLFCTRIKKKYWK